MAEAEVTNQRLSGLSPREREIATEIGKGKTNLEIAQTLRLQEQSIKNLVSSAMRKLKVRNRVELALVVHGIYTADNPPQY